MLMAVVEEKRERDNYDGDDKELLKSYFSFVLPFFGVALCC